MEPMDNSTLEAFWSNMLRSLGTEPRPIREIRGVSGITHHVLALGVDEHDSRLVLISDEPTARGAAMLQVDIAATLPGTRVIVARVSSIDLASIASMLIGDFGKLSNALKFMTEHQDALVYAARTSEKLKELGSRSLSFIDNNVNVLKSVPVGKFNAFLGIIDQLKLVDIASDFKDAISRLDEDKFKFFDEFNLEKLIKADLSQLDLEYGVCPIALPKFEEKDVEILCSGSNLENGVEILKGQGIFQYFYPPGDALTLGLIDHGVSKPGTITEVTSKAADLGHPYGSNDLVSGERPIEWISKLKDSGLAVEGELGLEVGPNGKTLRATIKFKPSEGLIYKLLNRCGLNLNINPSDFIR